MAVKAGLGAIRGADGGRMDTVKVNVPEGAYVIPADVVSAIGEGNSEAGMKALSEMFPAKSTKRAAIPVAVSHGEFIVTPENVNRLHGGSDALDAFVLHTRKMYARKLTKLPRPRK